MRSIVVRSLGDPSVLEIEQIDICEPSFGEVRVRLHAIGVFC
jgi:NADPH:quinone reductase-like Zn-dependent oxidoreductase